MKKYIYAIGLFALLVPFLALGATFMTNSNVQSGQIVEGNLYVAGSNIFMAGTVKGDFISAGGTLNVVGNVEQDAALAGGNLNITGTIGGDLRAAGGTLTLNGQVKGEVIMTGGQIVVGPNAVVMGDLVASGGEVTIDPAAKITGKQTIMNGKEKMGQENSEKSENPWMEKFGAKVFTIIVLMITAIFFSLIYKGWMGKVINSGIDKKTFWKRLGFGFAILILMPIVAVLLMATVVGALMGAILLLGYIVLLMMSAVFGGVIFGGLLQSYFQKKGVVKFHWGWVLGGIVIAQLLTLIPFIGWFFGLILFVMTIGTLMTAKFEVMKSLKVKNS